jgi:hypothetical protein
MAKRSIKQDKKPDIIMRTFAFGIDWVKANLKLCVAGAVTVLVVCLCVAGYVYYSNKQDDKAEYLLSQGMQSFAQYNSSGSEEALKKAEDAFNKTVNEKRKKTAIVARLYLGKIDYMKGKTEEAKKIYKEIQSESSDPTVKMLSERALSYIDKK